MISEDIKVIQRSFTHENRFEQYHTELIKNSEVLKFELMVTITNFNQALTMLYRTTRSSDV